MSLQKRLLIIMLIVFFMSENGFKAIYLEKRKKYIYVIKYIGNSLKCLFTETEKNYVFTMGLNILINEDF